MRVAVVIPFYNGDVMIRPCVESLLSGTYPLQAIYIVNNSTLPTQVAHFFSDNPLVQVLDTQPGIGFGRANNVGAYKAIAAGAELVVTLNQDAHVFSDTIAALVQPFVSDAGIALAAPLICTYEAPYLLSDTYLKMYLAPMTELLSDVFLAPVLKPYYHIPHAVSGACMAIRTSAIQALGLFDPLIHMYGEDVELFGRYKGRGYGVVLVPAAKVAHAHGHALAQGQAWQRIKQQIHRHTPYSIWTSPGVALLGRIRALCVYLLREYASAAFKGKILLLAGFLAEDLSAA